MTTLFALYDSMFNTPSAETLLPCPVCHGKGKQTATVTGKSRTYDVECIWCRGKGTMTEEGVRWYRVEQAIWCKCDLEREAVYYDNKEHTGCYDKHHWHCKACGLVQQIG